MNKLICILLLSLGTFLLSCDQKEGQNNSNLALARGGVGEIILVMDSASWRNEVGEALRSIFREPIPGLPQEEPMYTLRHVNPLAMNDVLRNARNLIFVTTLEGQSMADRRLRSYFTKESMEKIRDNPDLFMLTKRDEFAREQFILHLFGQTEAMLAKNLKENAAAVRSYFDEAESKKLQESLFAKEEKGIQKSIQKKHGFSMKVPYGYKIVKDKENFIWLRQLGRETDRNIFVAYRNYDEEGLFSKNSILDFRESITEKYITDSENEELHVTTQTIAPVDTTEINLNGNYAVKTRGLWKLTDNSLGGPFISYTFVDEEINRLYYIEGYVSSPGNDKRNLMKEMEAILSTFKAGT